MMNNKHTTLNIKMKWADKKALIEYAQSQGESVSVIIRRMIKEMLIKKGFIQPIKNDDFDNHQGYHLESDYP
jgi:hypothetical protein